MFPGIPHVEVESTPRLPGKPLWEVDAARLVLFKERLHVGHLDGGQDQRALARGELGEVGLMDEPEVETRVIA